MRRCVHCSIHHNLTEDHIEKFSPPVWHPGGFHVNITAFQRLRTVKVEPGVEESRVFPGDDSALLLIGEPSVVQLRGVGHVDAQPVQVVDIVSVGGDLICNIIISSVPASPAHLVPGPAR